MVHSARSIVSPLCAAALATFATSAGAQVTQSEQQTVSEPATPIAEDTSPVARAQTASRLGRHREAAEHLADAITRVPEGDAAERARLQALLKAEKAHVATVLVKLTNDVPATILVDGVAVGPYPLRLPLYLDPGEHTFAAVADGSNPETNAVRFISISAKVAANQAVTVTLREGKVATEAVSPPKPVWPAVLLGSLGAAALGVGIGTLVVSLARESDIEDRAAAIGTCNLDALSSDCGELTSLMADRNGLRNASTIAFVASGILAASTLGYLFIPLPAESEAPPPAGAARAARMSIAPVVTGDTVGVFAIGAF